MLTSSLENAVSGSCVGKELVGVSILNSDSHVPCTVILSGQTSLYQHPSRNRMTADVLAPFTFSEATVASVYWLTCLSASFLFSPRTLTVPLGIFWLASYSQCSQCLWVSGYWVTYFSEVTNSHLWVHICGWDSWMGPALSALEWPWVRVVF